MIKIFEIEGATFEIDAEATANFYVPEGKIVDNCDCEDCAFYANILIKEPFEIFKILSSMGVDLEKNLSSEPTGVWTVRDEAGVLLHCGQSFKMIGKMHSDKLNEIVYSKIDNGYWVNVLFAQYKLGEIYISLDIDKVR